MKRYAMLSLLCLSGCATTGGVDQAAMNNVLMALVGQATGVYLGTNCVAPPIPVELLNPCAPLPSNTPPEVINAAFQNCVTSSVALVAVAKYAQKICTPTK